MDVGLSPQQDLILRRARVRHLRGASSWQIIPPLWAVVVVTLVPVLVLWHPVRYLFLLLIPGLGYWQRHRVAMRLREWALDLREL
jgi:hypothetical protein